jgi:hypothetical protein
LLLPDLRGAALWSGSLINLSFSQVVCLNSAVPNKYIYSSGSLWVDVEEDKVPTLYLGRLTLNNVREKKLEGDKNESRLMHQEALWQS